MNCKQQLFLVVVATFQNTALRQKKTVICLDRCETQNLSVLISHNVFVEFSILLSAIEGIINISVDIKLKTD